MKTELLHKYFRGETTEKEESQIVEWTESSAENKERFLKERMLFDITLFSDDSKIQRKPKGHLYLYPLIAIAAMLAIVFVMDLPHMHKPKQQLSQTIRIPAGQRAQCRKQRSETQHQHQYDKKLFYQNFPNLIPTIPDHL